MLQRINEMMSILHIAMLFEEYVLRARRIKKKKRKNVFYQRI